MKPKKSILTLLIALMTIVAFPLFVENAVADAEGTMSDQDTGTQYIMPGDQKVVQEVIINDGGGDGGNIKIDYFRLDNLGTASNNQMENVSLWQDMEGDGEFNPVNDQLLNYADMEYGFNNSLSETGTIVVGEDNSRPLLDVGDGASYTIFVVVTLSASASEDSNTIKILLDGNELCDGSPSEWIGSEGREIATSPTIIDTIPTGTLSVDQDVVNEKELEFSVRVAYYQEMNTAVAPTIQFSGNMGATSLVTASWDGSHTIWLGNYTITDVDEGSSVTVSSSGAEDLNGNAEGACDETIFRVDTAAPSIDSVTGSTTGTTGETTTISAAFSDNIEVANATMHYMMLGSGWQSKSILSGSADIDIPFDSTTVWYYYVTVNDSADNGVRSPSGTAWFAVLITDNDAPIFSDIPTTHPTEGEEYNFTISVSDNIEVDTVYLNYYFAGSWNNESMAYNDISGKYFKVLNVPESATILHYNVSANDTNNNWNETGDNTLSVDDESNGGNQGPGPNEPPVADAGGPYQGTVNQTMIFDGSTSFDSDGIIVNYTWDFGDNTTGYGVKPTHIYNHAGLYSINLTVKDDEGKTNTASTTVNITIDSDGDGYSDEMEDSYGTNASDATEYPIDTDNDGTPDNDSPDGIYMGDTDDDNDWLSDDAEQYLGSDSKNESDVKSIDGIEDGYLVDTDGGGQYDTFYNSTSEVTTNVTTDEDGNYLIDADGDGEIDYSYDPESEEVTPYKEPEIPGGAFPMIVVLVMVVIVVLGTVMVLFKKGYLHK